MHCCKQMENIVRSNETALVYMPHYREYGIKYSDGGTSCQLISHCPWCGKKLPSSMRERWFEELEKLGLEPGDKAVPKKFLSDKWFKS